MALGDRQKAFYDTKRYFQGRDDPDTPAAPPAGSRAMPRGQILAGFLFLAVIALAFWAFGRNPVAIHTGPANSVAPAAPAAAH